MPQHSVSLQFDDEAATSAFAARLARRLEPGDTVLLEGEVGAGKTHLARSLIKSVLPVDEDVPSPTFTLVQVYDTSIGPIWHCDLYRLSSEFEIEELGLTEAFDDAICLVEWPDRLGQTAPINALSLALTSDTATDVRSAQVSWSDDKWNTKLDWLAIVSA